MSTERKEPTYLFSDKQVADKSAIARRFLEARTRLNANVDKADNFLVKRFYNIDHNTYLGRDSGEVQGTDGAGGLGGVALRRLRSLPPHPVLSAGSHTRRATGVAERGPGGGRKLVIPHLRRAYELLAELYG
jgi:hypothetical protein